MKKIVLISIFIFVTVQVYLGGQNVDKNGRSYELDRKIALLEKENQLIEKQIASSLSIKNLSEKLGDSYKPIALSTKTDKEISYVLGR